MEAVCQIQQSTYVNGIPDYKFLTNENLETIKLCKGLTETSPAYNITTIAGGKVIVLIQPSIKAINKNQIKTYVEVDIMKQNNFIKSIYQNAIIGSLCLVALMLVLLVFSIPIVPVEILLGIIFFGIVGTISFTIDRNKFLREIKKYEEG